ncbi:MAG: hypothetical protein J5658_07845 [Prevotella sp.]|nr:hypothetical protein [Prevotella sp.]
MTDFEYIVKQVKKFHFTKWDDGELRKCVDMLPNLSRQELTSLYYSKWVKEDWKFRDAVFNALFADKVGKREERIKNLDTDALIEEFKDKKSGNVALIRKEMRERYKANKDFDRSKIATAFNASIKMDQQWVKSQVRKERYGDSGNNYQWKKTSWK